MDGDEEHWKGQIGKLREELFELWCRVYDFRLEGKLTLDQSGQIFRAFNSVFARAGLSDPYNDPNDALTFAVFRDGIHQLRASLAREHPLLAEELNRDLPPRER